MSNDDKQRPTPLPFGWRVDLITGRVNQEIPKSDFRELIKRIIERGKRD